MEDRSLAIRVLDANINRAGEGLRTLEDFARLVRQDSYSALQLKELRHELAVAAEHVPRESRLTFRSLLSDAGTQHTVPAESARGGLGTVMTAASERVLQSLRCCEEFSKLLSSEAGEKFKALRYKAYDQLAQIELRLSSHSWLGKATLCVLVNCQQSLHDFSEYLKSLAGAGTPCIQLREKNHDDNALLRYAESAVKSLQGFESHLIINDRVDIALAVGAAGVHVGQEDLPIHHARKVAGHKLVIGVSTHSLQQALTAQQDGADYIGCGPTFPSQTKQFPTYAGVPLLKTVAEKIQLPAFAIGGIHEDNLQRVLATGIRRIAVSAAVHSSPHPTEVVKSLLKQLAEPPSK